MKVAVEKRNFSTSVSNTTVAGLYGYDVPPILDAVTIIPWLMNNAM